MPNALLTPRRLTAQSHGKGHAESTDTHMARQAILAEVFSDTPADAAAIGFVLAHLHDPANRPVLWVQDRLSQRESGKPCLAGLRGGDTAGGGRLRLLHVNVARPVDVLWAMEEGLRCTALAAVIGEVWGDAPALDFTATKRLALRAEANGVPAWLIRRAAQTDLSAARERWRIASLPALQHPEDSRAPGAPQWRAELFRARLRSPGSWIARPDPASGALRLSHRVMTQGEPSAAQPRTERAAHG